MLTSENYDVVVVGGGNTALMSALSAREAGAKVLVLEKAPKAQRGGNGCFTLGSYRATYNGIEEIRKLIPDLTEEEAAMDIPPYTIDDFYNEMMQVTDGMIDPELLGIITEESNKIIHWLGGSLGVKWELSLNSFRHIGGRLVFQKGRNAFQCKGGGYALSELLYGLIEQRGIDLLYDTMATGLLVDRGRVYGVRIQKGNDGQNVKSKAVILACGGFEANAMWRAAYLGKGWDMVKVRGTKYNTGDGLRMALDIGAQPYGNWSGCHATLINDDPQPSDKENFDRSMSHMSYNYGLLINLDGKRFVDEGEDMALRTYAKYGQHILAQPGCIAFELFNSKCEELLDLFYANRNRIESNSIEELAEKLGINQEALSETVTQFSRSTEGSPFDATIRDGLHTVGISPAKSNWAQKLDSPPFFAFPVKCGITFTWGGLKINRHAQVLNTADEVTRGLYTAGEMVGGIYYNNYSGGTGQLTGAIFGRIAGANAASEA